MSTNPRLHAYSLSVVENIVVEDVVLCTKASSHAFETDSDTAGYKNAFFSITSDFFPLPSTSKYRFTLPMKIGLN